jgi:CRISPR-associated endoribonuclease Cas6
MLLSLILELRSPDDATLAKPLGRANYAATLQRLAAVAPHLDKAIHAGNGPKPLTCSDLFGPLQRRRGRSMVQADTRYWVRMTGLTAAVSQALLDALWARRPDRWTLSDHPFQVTDVFCDRSLHPHSGLARYEDLASHQLLGEGQERPDTRVTLRFLSPTAFSSKGMQMPLPLPGLVFGSLVDRWNTFSPVELSPHVRAFGEDVVAVSKFDIKSVLVPQKNGGRRAGAVGEVSYVAQHDDRWWLAAFQMLADFALFSGVGVQTSNGMGQCVRV